MQKTILKRQTGISMLEILLSLAIAATIVAIGIRQYSSFADDRDRQQLLANVDKLFQAAGFFYQANCAASVGTMVRKLDPAQNPPSLFPINIATDLAAAGYLNKWPFPLIPFVTNYVVQINQMPSSTKNQFACWNFGTTNATLQCGAQQPIQATQKTVKVWRVQVAVQVAKPDINQKILGADCRSSLSGSTVTPCATSGNTGNYVVWERLPSFASPLLASPLSQSMFNLQLLNFQETHDVMYEMANATYASQQNYLCGG